LKTAPSERPTVLFVDDDVDLTKTLALTLRRERFRVLTANSGADALEVLSRRPIDVVVSDDQMPAMTGSELLARVRASWPSVVRILLTGQTDIRRAASAVNDANVFRFLLKPCDPGFLVSTLEAAFAASPPPVACKEDEQRQFDDALSQMWLAHQPIYDRAGDVAGFELLLRSASTSFRGPEPLLAMASALQRTAELERSFSRRALVIAEVLAERLVFINVDPPALARDDLFTPLVPHAHHIVLEITERDERGDPLQLARRIRALKGLGFKVAVDDLGSGYAGLNAVVDLAPDIVKLDMKLIRDVHQSFVKQRLIRSVCEAAHDLSIKVVAEGIERLEELDATFDAGCHYFQGYLLGRPAREPARATWPRREA
jgi:EAL domain-containing protein (putative c-di-GMP-specific phosphodiesterase class I)